MHVKTEILTLPCVSFTLRSMEHVRGLPTHFTMKILHSVKIYDWICVFCDRFDELV